MDEIYLDNSATTAVSRPAAEIAYRMMTEGYGNPSSLHRRGFLAERAMEEARGQIAGVLGADAREIYFTSCGTEANNLAVLGGARARARRCRRVVATAIEHESVLACCGALRDEGWETVLVPPEADGSVSPQKVAAAVTPDTAVVSVMLVNSETGAVNDLRTISALARRIAPEALIHSDCVQAFCRLPVRPEALGCDAVSVSGHKIHAPKGIGALYLRRGARVQPVLRGSGQERGLRPGTENIPGICAMGLAAQRMWQGHEANYESWRALRALLERRLAAIPGVALNSPENGVPYICNLSAVGVRSETMIHFLEQSGIYVSSGSACAKGARSHVLTAMGLPEARVDSAIRVSMTDTTSAPEIEAFCAALERGMAGLVHRRG